VVGCFELFGALNKNTLNPASFGQSVTFTATIVPSVSATFATGTVAFFDGASSIGGANLSNNVAQISAGNFALGSHSITAGYAGDRNFTGSTSAALSEVVNPAPTSTVVTSSANPAIVTSNVTFTATVSSSISGTQKREGLFLLGWEQHCSRICGHLERYGKILDKFVERGEPLGGGRV
jgi:Na+-transporting NADH:ubiquinone oxidoreductase subunit NqrB